MVTRQFVKWQLIETQYPEDKDKSLGSTEVQLWEFNYLKRQRNKGIKNKNKNASA